MGYTFKSKTGTNTVTFPASGYRDNNGGLLLDVGNFGFYWSAAPCNTNAGGSLGLYSSGLVPLYNFNRSSGFAVRPVADE